MTESIKALLNLVKHAVGNVNNINVKTVNGGVLVSGADVDNFTLVELGFDADGERICQQLSAKTNKAYLVATPEFRPLDEAMVSFYNAVGDRARVIVLEPAYTRFDTSAYTLNTGVTAIANGQVAHFDVATKKFIISAAGTPHADYAGSSAQFTIVSNEDDALYTDGFPLVRLECSKA